ncbi:helix-turn-helix domain-containing protein [Pseudomonas sp. QL9]|uniref:Proline utilization regulator n=1 Tax=Pseudomonas knackmussii (strain DSM 6978 / CCUG 54928 / LMG 23759 / B13) TaxID=1301098 RepID=A0A024HDU9_PSEKB|nr:AraC family transcriptional regulator [Pseudomonas knackmussii]CDF82794.1 proline utilization regulator [Pseudomonas knackmussii B13]
MLETRVAQLSEQSHAHAHVHHQLVMSLAGRAAFEVDGKGGEVCPMRACLVPGEAGHAFAGVGDNRMLIVDLDPQDGADEEREMLARLFDRPRYPTLDADLQSLLGCAGAELERHGRDPLLARALGGALIRALHLRLIDERAPEPGGPLDLQRLDAHMRANLGRRICIAELAQLACLSPSHFHAQFKDSVGLTPHQYLLKLRLDCAARLLRESDLSLVRVAGECGFSSQSALTTAMRRHLGLTPGALRRG